MRHLYPLLIPITIVFLLVEKSYSAGFKIKDQLGFISNVGQLEDENIQYYLERRNLEVHFYKNGKVSYTINGHGKQSMHKETIELNFNNAHPVQPNPVGKSYSRVNFVKGKTNYQLIDHNRLKYNNIYSNIDLVYYVTENGSLKYDFIVHPGGDPQDIAIDYHGGVSKKVLDKEFLIETKLGTVKENEPYSYQSSGEPVKSSYMLSGNTLHLKIGAYDQTRTLIIDPEIDMLSSIGGSNDDFVEDIITDNDGNIYVAGHTNSDNVPVLNAAQTTKNDFKDAYLAKLDADGNLLWATFYGGSENDVATGITLDASNNVYVTGYTESTNFPTTGTSINRGGNDLFVIKLSENGNIVNSTLFGGDSDDEGTDIEVGKNGNVYVLGSTASEFFPSENPIQGSGSDIILMKLDSDLSFVYASYLGGNTGDEGLEMALDKNGSPIITGVSSSDSGFISQENVFQEEFGGVEDGFLVKLNESDGSIQWGTYLGGSEVDYGQAVTVDSDNNYYVAGYTLSSDFPTKDAFQPSLSGKNDGYVSKFNSSGTLLWSTYVGGSNADDISGLTTDEFNNVYLLGTTQSADLLLKGGQILQSSLSGGDDIFINTLNNNGELIYSTYYGGSDNDFGVSLHSSASRLYLAAHSESTGIANENYDNEGGLDYLISTIDVSDLQGQTLDSNNVISIKDSSSCINTYVELKGSDINDLMEEVNVSYQYQNTDLNGDWVNVEDINGDDDGTDYDFRQLLTLPGTYYYRRIAYNSDSSVVSVSNTDSIEVVSTSITDNVIQFGNGNSVSFSQCKNDSNDIIIKGSEAIVSSGSVNYQYVIYDNQLNDYRNIGGADSANFLFDTDTSAGNYTIGRLAISNDDSKCFDLSTVDISIDSQLVTDNYISTSFKYICEGTNADINGSEPDTEFSSYTYQYYDSIPGGTWEELSGTNTQSISYSLNNNETAYVFREVILQGVDNSCLNSSNVIELFSDSVKPQANFITITENDYLCADNEIAFEAVNDYTSSRDSIINYFYDFDGLYTAAVPDTSVTLTNGVYEVFLETTSINGCTNDTTIEITVHPKPDIDAGDDIVLQGNSAQLNATTSASNVDSIYWMPTKGLSESDILDPIVDTNKTTVYEITIVNDFACKASDSVTVFVVSDTLLDTTNVISLASEPNCLDSRIFVDGSDLETIIGVIGFTYQYQDSTQGGTWMNSEDPLSQNVGQEVDFMETVSTAGTIYYRRIAVGPDAIYTDTSNVVSIEIVNQNISDNTLIFGDGTSEYSQCENDPTPIEIIGSEASAATGDVDYQYAIFDSVNNQFVDIPNAVDKDYLFDLDSSAGTYKVARYAVSTLNPSCYDLDTIDLVLDEQIINTENTIDIDTNLVCSNSEVLIDGSEIEINSSLYEITYFDSLPGENWNAIPQSNQVDLTYEVNEYDTVYIQRVITPIDADNSCLSFSNIIELKTTDTKPVFSLSMNPVMGGYCENNIISFKIDAPNDTYNYTWEFDGQATDLENDSVTNVFSAGTHSVFVSAESDIGCVTDTTFSFEVFENPVVDAGDAIYFNENDSPQLLASTNSTIIDSVRWNPSDGLSDPTVLQPSIIVPNTETYTVTVTDTNICQGKDTVEAIKVSCEAIVNYNRIEASKNIACLDESYELFGSNLSDSLNSTGFVYQYQDSIPNGTWSNVSAAGSESGADYNYNPNTQNPGIIYYRRIVTSPNDLCTDTSETISVEVIDQTVTNNEIQFNGSTDELTQCETYSGVVEITGSDAIANSGNTNYKYALYNSNLNAFVDLPNQEDRDLDLEIDTTSGTYFIGRYAISEDNPECYSIDTIQLTLDPQLISENTISTSSVLVCEDTEATIDGNAPQVNEDIAYVYYDSIPNGTWSEVANQEDFNYALQADTAYIVREVILPNNTDNVCSSFSNVIQLVKDSTYPVASFTYSSEDALCAGSVISFTETTPESDSVVSWNWDFDEVTSSNASDTALVFDKGVYDISLEVTSKSGCVDDTTYQIEIYPVPEINIATGDEITLSDEEEVQIQVEVINGHVDQANWIPTTGLSDPNALEPMLTVANEQLYIVEVSDTNGCADSDSIQVNFLDEFLIPTAFTPNNDGYNDDFEIVGIEDYPNASISIYNRWTVRVFQSNDLENNRWNGDYKGKDQPAGVYYYVLDLGNGSELIEGSITILK